MTHVTPGDGRTVVTSTLLGTWPTTPQYSGTAHRHLDRDRLHVGIANRRRTLAALEMAMVAACEKAAARSCRAARTVRMDDRETWDHAMWTRYLAAAARLEPEFGPPIRRLYQEIDQLERLIALPLPA